MKVGRSLDTEALTVSVPLSNLSDTPAATSHGHHSSHLAIGPWNWQDQDGDFVDDGIMVTGIIIAGVLLLVVCFCSIHFLKRLGLCSGANRSQPRTAVEEYREYRQQRLNEIFARYGGNSHRRSHPNPGRTSSSRQSRYARYNTHTGLPPNGRRDWVVAPTGGVDVQRNPRSGKFTYIRFSPSGIRYTNQSILVPSTGVRRDQGDRRPILPPRGRSQPMDMQGDGSLAAGSMAYSGPWTATESMMSSSYVSMGQSGDVTTGLLDGVPPSVGSRSEDLESTLPDTLGPVLETRELPEGEPSTSKAAQEQKAYTDIPELYLCPITQDVMEDPVMAADGFTYERKAIMEWLRHHRRSPMTNERMAEIVLIANHGLKSAIAEWRVQH